MALWLILFIYVITLRAEEVHFKGNGDFSMVGNVNFVLEGGYENGKETTKPLLPVDTDGDMTTTNSSSASFCFEGNTCENDSLVYVGLSWSGKVMDDAEAASNAWQSVKFKVNNETYSVVTAKESFRSPFQNNNQDNKGLYTCHADVTSYFSKKIEKGLSYKVTVADIVSETDASIATKFGGWTLTVIYRQKEKDERTVHYYSFAEEKAYEPCGANSQDGKNIKLSLNLADPYSGIGDIIMATSIVGGARQSTGDAFYVSSNANLDFGSDESAIYRLKAGSSSSNYLHNSMQMRSGCSGDKHSVADGSIEYTRGCDLHIHKFAHDTTDANNNTVYSRVAVGDDKMNVFLTGNSEHHLITDIVVMTNVAQTPRIEAVQEAQSADSSVIYTINIRTKENVEDLNNFSLNVQLPDYGYKITDLSITGDLLTNVGDKNSVALGVNPREGSSYQKSLSADTSAGWFSFGNLDGDVFKKSIASHVNQSVSTVKAGQNLLFRYSGVIPAKMASDTVLKISFRVWLDLEKYTEKSRLDGSKPTATSQSQMGVTGTVSGTQNSFYSNPQSVLDSLQICDDFYNFGSGAGLGGGDGPGGGGGSGTSVNGQPTAIELDFDYGCSNIPDTIHIDGCVDACLDLSIIEEVLIKEYDFNVKKEAEKDSLNWIEVKRDEIISICQLGLREANDDHVTIRRGNENSNIIYSDTASWYDIKKYWTGNTDLKFIPDHTDPLFGYLKGKCAVDSAYIIDEIFPRIDEIIKRPVSYSHIEYELDKSNVSWNTPDGPCIPVENAVYFVLYDTPYHKGVKSTFLCVDTLFIDMRKEKVALPHLYKGPRFIAPGDTIQYCLDAKIDTLQLVKKKKNYQLSFKDSLEKVSFLEYVVLSDTIYKYVPTMSTDVSDIDSFKIVQINNGGCVSDTFTFYIEVLDVKSTIKPRLPKDTIVCWVNPLEKDSILLSVTNMSVVDSMRNEGFDLAWYLIDDKNHNDSLLAKDVTAIRIPKDSVNRFGYGVTFYYLGCESEMDTFIVDVKGLPKKLVTPDISFCQYVKPDSTFVASATKSKNTQTDYKDMLWYPMGTTLFNEKSAGSLPGILTLNLDFDKCGEKNLIVQPKSEYGCLGDTSLVTMNVICYDSTGTKFKNEIDSVLFCIGDATKEIASFIDTALYPKDSKWVWYEEKGKVPVNTVNELSTAQSITPSYNTEKTFAKDYYLARVDKNKCISNPSKFRVVVGDSIQSTPFIGDTTQVDYTNNAALVEFCQGVHLYKRDILPLKATVDGYTMEAVKKTSFTDDCDTLLKYEPKRLEWNSKKQDKIELPVNESGTTYYCIRQSTPMGCHGPWATITIMVNDSVKGAPSIDTIQLCQKEDPVLVADYVTNTTNMNLSYYDADKKVIDVMDAVVTTDEPAQNLTTLRNNLFYVSYRNSDTKCESRLVGVESIIHPKPQMPVVAKDTLYFCADTSLVDLTAASQTTIYPSDKNTSLVWQDASSLLTDRSLRATYYVHQVDTLTGCVGDKDTVEVYVEKTFSYQHVDTTRVCYGETVDLWTKVNDAIQTSNSVIKNAKAQFTIQYLSGTTPQKVLSQEEAMKVASHQLENGASVERYLVTIDEPISTCKREDTVVVVFNALPKLDKINSVTKCQYEPFDLPTPTSDYLFQWYRKDGSAVAVEKDFSLEKSEELTLVATTKEVPACQSSETFQVNINDIPALPLVADTTLCQYTGKHELKYQLVGTAENPLDAISLAWMKTDSSFFARYNTDSAFVSKVLQEKVIAVVTNPYTSCSSSKEITVSVHQKMSLSIDDPTLLCQPETFDAVTFVNQYISANRATMGGNEPTLTGYYTLYPSRQELTTADMAALAYNSKSSKVDYIYQMTDAKKICVVEDTFTVTIHPKPAVPMIAAGEDSLFFCRDKAPLMIVATDTTYTKSLQLVWQDGTLDSPYQLDEALPSAIYSVYLKDTVSLCQGDPTSVVAVVANPIVVKPIGGKDTLHYCVGETVNLWMMAYQSFVVDRKYRSDVSITSAKRGTYVVDETTLESYTSWSQDTSTFYFTVEDALTHCSQDNQVTVVFHRLPDFHVEGETEVCVGDDISLSVVGDDRPISYDWYYNDQLLNNDKAYKQSNMSKDTTLTVEATLMQLTRCKTRLSHFVKVNPLPEPLRDTLVEFCQDTTAAPVKVNFKRSAADIDLYSIQWYDETGEALQSDEDMLQDIQHDGVTKYQAEVINRKTGCVSPRAVMTVTVHPQVRIHWTNPDTICQPYTYNLMTDLTKSVYGGTNPRFQSATTADGTEVEELTAISENSKLTVFYKDDYGCELMQNVSVQFYTQPQMPTLKGKTIVCQSTGEVVLTATKNGTNTRSQTFQWTGGGQDVQSDELSVSIDASGTTDYVLRAVDTLSHCYSEPVAFTMDIRKKIGFEPVGLLESCYNVPIDLPSKVEGNYYGSEEEKYFSYYSLTATGNVLSVGDPSNVLKSGKYIVKASELESGCERQDTVDVVVYDSIAIYATGQQEICYGAAVVDLKANHADAYKWRRASGVIGEGEAFPYADAVSETETFRLIGEKKLGTLYCYDSIDVTVKVNPLPEPLRDTLVEFCQDTAAAPVKVNFKRSAADVDLYSIQWYDEAGEALQSEEEMLQDIQHDGVTKYQAEVINRKTGCVSPRAVMTVTVHPQVRIHWTNPDTICQPYTYNLMTDLTKSVYGGTNPRFQSATTADGTEVEELTAISENSKLTVYYKDDYGCELQQAVSVQFYAQPKQPTLVGDTIVCQATGDVTLSANKVGSNTMSQTFAWTGGGRDEQSDLFKLSTAQFGTTDYELRSIDTLSHCYSEPVAFTMDIRKNIQYKPVGLLESCYNVPIDLPSKVEGNYYGSEEEKHFSYYSLTATGNVLSEESPSNVLKSGRYIVKASESESGCERQDTIDVVVYDSIAIYATGQQEICYGASVVDLKANHADAYKWRRAGGVTAEGESFPFADAVRETETFRLIGEKKLGTLYCFDSIDVSVKVNPLPLTLKDTTVYFCQDGKGEPATIALKTQAERGESLRLIYEEPFEGTTSVQEAGTTTYRIRQQNSLTGCLGDYSKVTAVVHPQIEVSLPDSATCEPATINLLQIAQRSATAGAMTSQITTDAVLLSSEGDREVTAQADALAGSGLYTVRYSYTANDVTCKAEGISKLTFHPRPIVPTVEDQAFCQRTGAHALEGMPSDNHLRLIWEDLSASPYKVDTIQTVVTTEVASTKYYHVRQIQDVSGCVSPDATITVTIHPAVKPQSYVYDVCVGDEVYMEDVIRKHSIKDEVLSLYNETRSVQYADLLQNLAETARYQFVIQNEHGCRATDTLKMTVHAPENLTLRNLDTRQRYCYGDLANVAVSTTNASTFKWLYRGDTLVSDSYRQPIVKLADTLHVIAYENEMGCKLEDSIIVYAHPKIELEVEGNTNVCAGTQVELSLSSDGLSKVEWSAIDTTSRDYLFSFYPSVTQNVKAKVVNTNNCTDSTSVVVNVAAVPAPLISVANSNFTYENTKYTIDKDNPSVDLKALALSDLEHLTVAWTFGDGDDESARSVVETSHTYDKDVFVYNLPKTVSVEVTHDYGCTGTAVATVTIDPSIDIPNTFYVDGESLFMEDNKLQIFDRVGTLIHEGYGWDGTYKGKPASDDTYFYALHYYVGGEEKVETGYVTVVH